MNKYAENLHLFQKALIEATNEKTQMIMKNYTEDISFSKQHKKTMKRILAFSPKSLSVGHNKFLNKKRFIALLVAIIVLTIGGLTVYAKRDAVIHFFEQVYEKFIQVLYQGDQDNEKNIPDTIEKEYVPSYVPKGYELQEYVYDLSSVQVKWQSSDEAFICFEQSTIGTIYGFDNEHGNFEELTVGEYTVYSVHYGARNKYLWNDGKYSYSIECSVELSLEEISQMILSVTEKK